MQATRSKVIGDTGYRVDEDGNIHSPYNRILSPRSKSNGYLYVQLGKGNERPVHQLVAEAFCDRQPHHEEVHHINADRTDNRACNLQWITHSDNMRESGKLTQLVSPDGRVLEFRSRADAAEAIGCHPASITKVLTGVKRSIKGYTR